MHAFCSRRGLVVSIAALCFFGCSQTYTPPEAAGPPKGSYTFQLHIANLKPLDSTSGQYVLWVQMLGDPSWYSAALNSTNIADDSTGYIKLPRSPDSIVSAFISMEPSVIPASPTSLLMAGAFDRSNDSAFLSSSNAGGVGDLSQALAAATFTTKFSNATLAENEFFLMRFVNGVSKPSCANLPIAPNGWSYGLWVVDSNFYPLHKFFYGAFTNPDSADTHPTSTDYPFPGGFNYAPLNDPGGQLEVTLEPSYTVAGSAPAGPSPLIILWGRLFSYLNLNDTLALQNSWQASAPSGTLTIH